MRILHLNSTDINGGAAKAAMRTIQGLVKLKADINYLVKRQFSSNHYVSCLHHPIDLGHALLGSLIERPFFSSHPLKYYYHKLSPIAGVNSSHIKKINPALLHLHQINYGTFALSQLQHLKRPIVWTLHDIWPLSGGCHYSFGCDGFAKTCGHCPLLSSEKSQDASFRQFQEKQRIYNDLNIYFVAPSEWILRQATRSPLTRNKQILHIPNGIDTGIFRPLNKEELRAKYHLPKDKKIILFLAHQPLDERKGFSFLEETLKLLVSQRKEIFLLIVGNDKGFTTKTPCPWAIINPSNDETRLIELINCADISIAPSLEDNLPNIILESMACGVPVIGFNRGGIPEMIDDGVNGFLAENNAPALAKAIEKLLTDKHLSAKMSLACREKCVKSFNQENIAQQHKHLYETILTP